MRVKSLLMVIVMNIFLMLLSSVLFEYVNLSDRFQSLENTIQTSLDSSIALSTSSEEMFSEEFSKLEGSGANMSSIGTGDDKQSYHVSYPTALVWDNNNAWHQYNIYEMSKYYQDNSGKLPRSGISGEDLFKKYEQGKYGTTGAIYQWLYQDIGSSYTSDSLAWANRNWRMQADYESAKLTGRTDDCNSNFKTYYFAVGHKQTTAGYVKERQYDIVEGQTSYYNGYSLVMKTFPTLVNMGGTWMTKDGKKDEKWTMNYNRYTDDNFTSTVHMAKSYRGSKRTYFYLTPMSLGVTYIPKEVLKPTFLANLETTIRLRRLSAADLSVSNQADVLNSANKCDETSVYIGDRSTTAVHDNKSKWLMNDGLVEYELDTAQLKVDYFYIDFSDSDYNNGKLISKLNGCISASENKGYSSSVASDDHGADVASLRSETMNRFREEDSYSGVSSGEYRGAYGDVKDQRIVARVSVKIKVHVPYKSPILQWLCRMTDTTHFDIKLYDPKNRTAVRDSDGIWYTYTTYYMQTRT